MSFFFVQDFFFLYKNKEIWKKFQHFFKVYDLMNDNEEQQVLKKKQNNANKRKWS